MDLPNKIPNLSPDDIYNGLVGSLIWWALAASAAGARYLYGIASRRLRVGTLTKVVISASLVFGLAAWAIHGQYNKLIIGGAYVSFILSFYYIFRGHFQAGLVDAFGAQSRGIDFASSLKLTRLKIDFLGIGAHKLTSLDEFEEAVRRCTEAGQTCRFLLSPPENSHLEALARRNGATPSAYQENVRQSLRTLALLKRDRGMLIEVKFYPVTYRRDRQQFRLMFVDDTICLLGWTVWGAHLGRKNPQVVLRDAGGGRTHASLISAFKEYYEQLWDDAQPADLSKYI